MAPIGLQDAAPPFGDGRYQLIEEIGTGRIATVYLGFDRQLKVHRAIKVLAPGLARDEVLRRRFVSEARIMAQLDHPHVVRAHDLGTEGGRAYLVMDLVDGGSLAQRIREQGPLSQAQALMLTRQVLSGLDAAHARGVVHRDVKPGNVLLTRDGVPKLTDFGVALLVREGGDRLTATDQELGTMAFMAPEQRRDAREATPLSDVYSAGAVLYVLATGRRPVDLFASALDESLLADIDLPVAQVIQRATRYSPDERYASAREMAGACAEAAGDAPELSETLSGEDDGFLVLRSSPVGPLLLGLAGGLALTVAAVAWLSHEPEPAEVAPVAEISPPAVPPPVAPSVTESPVVASGPVQRPTSRRAARPLPEPTVAVPNPAAPAPAEPPAPELVHTPPTALPTGASLVITAAITPTLAYDEVSLRFRFLGQSVWQVLPMFETSGHHTVSLPLDAAAEGVEYYIDARSSKPGLPPLKSGRAAAPHTLPLLRPKVPAL